MTDSKIRYEIHVYLDKARIENYFPWQGLEQNSNKNFRSSFHAEIFQIQIN